MIRIKTAPRWVTGGAAYAYHPSLIEKYTEETEYGDELKLYHEFKQGNRRMVMVPRRCCTITPEVDKRVVGDPVAFVSSFKPRNDEQARIVKESSRLLVEKKESFILQAVPGKGKTVMSCQLIADVGRKTLVVVTKEDLRDQWITAATTFLGLKHSEIGVIQGPQANVANKKLVIAMVQSIAGKDKHPASIFRSFGLVIFDECHRFSAEYFSKCIWRIPALLRLGLSATPKRSDGRDKLFRYNIGPVKVRSSQMDLKPRVVMVESGYVVPRYWTQHKKTGKDIHKQIPHKPGRIAKLAKDMAYNNARNKIITDAVIQAYNKGRKPIVFSTIRDHLELLADAAVVRGIPEENIGLYVGGLKKHQRIEVAKKQVLFATYQYCSEGTDIPELDSAIFATPMSNIEQIAGRILRAVPGKKTPAIFDLVDRDSWVLARYANTRQKYYIRIGATVTWKQRSV